MPYLTGRPPASELAVMLRLQATYERVMQATMAREITRTMGEAADAFDAQGDATASVEGHRARTLAVFDSTYRQVMPAAGGRILEAAGKSWARHLRLKDARSEFDSAVEAFLAEHAARRVVNVTDTTMEQIRAAVVAAEREGLGQEAIARRIRDNAAGIARVRSLVIARTEVHTAATVASDEAAKATGVVEGREWISAEDSRTRPSHSEANGQVRGMGERFTVGDTTLEYPGEPGGPAAETINCRCVAAYIT